MDKGKYWMYVVQPNKAVTTTSATLGMRESVVRGKGTRQILWTVVRRGYAAYCRGICRMYVRYWFE